MSDSSSEASPGIAPELAPEPTIGIVRNRAPGPSPLVRLIKGSGWRILAQIMPLFVNLALTPFVITTLGPTGYGLWLVTSTLTQVIAHFDGGIGRSAQYFFSVLAGTDDRKEITRLLLSLSLAVVLISGVLLVPAMLFTWQLVGFFEAPPDLADDTAFLLRVFLILVVVSLLRNIFLSLLHAYERFALSSLSSLLSYVVYAAGLVCVLNAGFGLRGLALAFIAQHVVATIIVIPASLRHLTARGLGFVSWQRLLQVGRTSWRVQISGLLTVASMQGPLLIVAGLRPLQVPDFGPGATFAQQLRLIPMNAVAPIQSILGSSFGRDGAAATLPELGHLQRLWVRAVTGWCAIGIPAAFVGVNVWLPLEGYTAGLVAAVMLVAQWLTLLPQVLLQWQLLVRRAGYEMWSSACNAALLLGLSILLVPLIGAIGAAVATVIGSLGGLVLLLALSRSKEFSAPSLIREVPWLQAVVSGGLSTCLVWAVGQLIGAGFLPEGGLGLLLCGAAATPALMLFVLTTWGPQQVWRSMRSGVSALIKRA